MVWLRWNSERSICVCVSMCSTRSEVFSASFGLRTESAKKPDGSAATIVFVSNASTPSTESDIDVCSFRSGPVSVTP